MAVVDQICGVDRVWPHVCPRPIRAILYGKHLGDKNDCRLRGLRSGQKSEIARKTPAHLQSSLRSNTEHGQQSLERNQFNDVEIKDLGTHSPCQATQNTKTGIWRTHPKKANPEYRRPLPAGQKSELGHGNQARKIFYQPFFGISQMRSRPASRPCPGSASRNLCKVFECVLYGDQSVGITPSISAASKDTSNRDGTNQKRQAQQQG